MSQQQAMDRMYRYQRHFYDFTRKYYLLGRDKLVKDMLVAPNDNVLEIGCGTARNLIMLAKLRPQAHLFGLDASNEMLITAQEKIDAEGLSNNIKIVQCLAEDLDHQKTFGLPKKFDSVFYSYSLSMIPPWKDAVDAGIRNLKSKGTLYIVDFSDQRDLPSWFRKFLVWWLDLFGVHYQPALLPYLQELEQQGKGKLTIESLFKHYSFIAKFELAE